MIETVTDLFAEAAIEAAKHAKLKPADLATHLREHLMAYTVSEDLQKIIANLAIFVGALASFMDGRHAMGGTK